MEVLSSPLHRGILKCLLCFSGSFRSWDLPWTLVVLYLTWLYRDRHTPRMRGSPLCLGLELGNLEVFPRLLYHHGLVSSDKASASYLLTHPEGGQVAVLAVGGPLEASEAKPGTVSLWLWNQKGFIKLSLEHRALVVPVFSFGGNELFQQYPNPPGSWVRRVQEALQAMLSVALPLLHGHLGLLIPFRVPIHTVVGALIPVQGSQRPSLEQVDQLQALYVEGLTQLFAEHKTRFGVPADQHLVLT